MSNIVVKGLHKDYNKPVLVDVDIKINDGEFVSILGESGCGKTTLLNILCGIETPDSGEIYFDETNVTNLGISERKAVIVDQEILLFPHMTVFDNISFGLRMAKKDKNEIKRKVNELLEVIGLSGNQSKYPSQLSGGEKQRVAIARGIILKPKVLLLDETFSKLDVTLRESLRQFVKSIHKKYNITTILVTHDRDEAIELSDRIAVMVDGEVKQFDTPENIYKYPVNKKVSKLFGSKNYIPCRVFDNKLTAAIFDLNAYDTDKSEGLLVVRYEQVIISKDAKLNSQEMTISNIEFLGSQNIITLSKGDFFIKSALLDASDYSVGDIVNIYLNLDKIIIVKED